MTEEIAATPGWVGPRLDDAFAGLPSTPEVAAARRDYESCLAGLKAPAAPSDNLGAEFEPCRPALHNALRAVGLDLAAIDRLDAALEALEAEIAAGT